MPVDGWVQTSDLLCVDPGENFISSAYLGHPWPLPQPASPAFPSITVGSSDLSIEVWARKKVGNSPGQDEQFWTGIFQNDVPSSFPNIGAAIRWTSLDAQPVQLWFARVPGDVSTIAMISTALWSEFDDWTHVVGNYDRDGNMELFRNNISEGFTSMVAQAGAQAACEVHALTSDHAFPTQGTPDITSLSNYSAFPLMVGPMAIHNRLMTAAERQASLEQRTVQNFGSSVTFIRFDWKEFGGETGWDSDMARMADGHKFGLAVPGSIPLGASGTVTARDSSGNNRHWTLPTLATPEAYAARVAFVAVESGTWPIAFGADGEIR